MGNDRLKQLIEEADQAFDGKYAKELEQLNGFSREEINAITPDTKDLRTYSVLVKLVEEASRDNRKKAELLNQIKELGDVAVKIINKIPGFYEELHT